MPIKLHRLNDLADLLATDSIEYATWIQWVKDLADDLDINHPSTLTVKNLQRKWELVSAYQKTVRRGNAELAMHLMCGMVSLQEERQYMWRRICTTAAEDIGAGDPLVMKFVLACSSIWTPSLLTGQSSLAVWGFLTRLMCSAKKSRLYCQYSILDGCMKDKAQKYESFDSPIGVIMESILSHPLKDNDSLAPGAQWLVKQNWRAEGMAVGPIQHQIAGTVGLDTLTAINCKFPEPEKLLGLPVYAYDMHTQIGIGLCVRATGLPQYKELFAIDKPKDKSKAIGWALFFEEGGKIQDELVQVNTALFEQTVVAEKHGMTPDGWNSLRLLVRESVANGEFNSLRSQILKTKGY